MTRTTLFRPFVPGATCRSRLGTAAEASNATHIFAHARIVFLSLVVIYMRNRYAGNRPPSLVALCAVPPQLKRHAMPVMLQ
jgi:hypothetical protein